MWGHFFEIRQRLCDGNIWLYVSTFSLVVFSLLDLSCRSSLLLLLSHCPTFAQLLQFGFLRVLNKQTNKQNIPNKCKKVSIVKLCVTPPPHPYIYTPIFLILEKRPSTLCALHWAR